MEKEDPLRETGQDLSTGRKKPWMDMERAGEGSSVECCRERRQGKGGRPAGYPLSFAFCNARSLVGGAGGLWLDGGGGSQIAGS